MLSSSLYQPHRRVCVQLKASRLRDGSVGFTWRLIGRVVVASVHVSKDSTAALNISSNLYCIVACGESVGEGEVRSPIHSQAEETRDINNDRRRK